jgi:hypothetical protein
MIGRKDVGGRGQSLVEFALILPVFLLLFGTTLDLGRLFYATITLEQAAREAALEAARTVGAEDEDAEEAEGCDASSDRVICRGVLESKDSFVEVEAGDISYSCSPSCTRSLGNVVNVTISGQFQLLTPILTPFFGGSQQVDLEGTATAQIEAIPDPDPDADEDSDIEPPPPPPPPDPPTPQPTPAPTPTPAPGATPGPTPTPGPAATPTPSPTPYPYDCTQLNGRPGVIPPNVIGKAPATAYAMIAAKRLVPIAQGDLSTGQRNRVRSQTPDHTQCVELESDVIYHFRP